MYRIADNRIAEVWSSLDSRDLMRQISSDPDRAVGQVRCREGTIATPRNSEDSFVSDIIRQKQQPRGLDDAALATLARKTFTPVDVVRHIYDEELARLESTAVVKNFISVIASRNVRERLKRSRLVPTETSKRAAARAR